MSIPAGTLMVDDYGGYKALFRSENDEPPAVTEAGCRAHVRRRFMELFKLNGHPVAPEARVYTCYLFDLERARRERPAEQKRRWRRRYAKPLLKVFRGWLTEKEGC